MQQRSTRLTRWLATALGSALILGSSACDDKSFNEIVILGTANTITLETSSNNQTAVVGTALANPIVVHVLDQNGSPVQGALVTWAITAGGGSVSQATTLTDASGNASVTWTLGPNPGTNTLNATLANGASVTVTATGTAATTASTVKASGSTRLVAMVNSAVLNTKI
jgi:hypothetical protein